MLSNSSLLFGLNSAQRMTQRAAMSKSLIRCIRQSSLKKESTMSAESNTPHRREIIENFALLINI